MFPFCKIEQSYSNVFHILGSMNYNINKVCLHQIILLVKERALTGKRVKTTSLILSQLQATFNLLCLKSDSLNCWTIKTHAEKCLKNYVLTIFSAGVFPQTSTSIWCWTGFNIKSFCLERIKKHFKLFSLTALGL